MINKKNIKLGVGVIVLKNKNSILLGLRGPNVSENLGKWELLGGETYYDEGMKDTVKRNVREEAGIEVEPKFIVDTNDKYDDEKNTRWAGFTWLARLVSGEPHVVKEFNRDSDFRWVSLVEALNMDITPMTRLQLEQYKDWLKKTKSLID